jgi:hypothetical protein
MAGKAYKVLSILEAVFMVVMKVLILYVVVY